MLIGVTGYAQHGKDTVARVLVRDFGFVRVAFADALKDLALEVNPVIPTDPMNPSVTYRLAELVEHRGWEKAKTFPEVRRILQDLGVGARDIIGRDVWVQAAEQTWLDTGADNVVISDVRFPNEADFIHRHGGKLWRVERPGYDNGVGTDHPSEAYVQHLSADAILPNDSTLSEFEVYVSAQTVLRLGARPTWRS